MNGKTLTPTGRHTKEVIKAAMPFTQTRLEYVKHSLYPAAMSRVNAAGINYSNVLSANYDIGHQVLNQRLQLSHFSAFGLDFLKWFFAFFSAMDFQQIDKGYQAMARHVSFMVVHCI